MSLSSLQMKELQRTLSHSCNIHTTIKTVKYELYVGPYKRYAESGYMLQAINLVERTVITTLFPLKDNYTLYDIKQWLLDCLFK